MPVELSQRLWNALLIRKFVMKAHAIFLRTDFLHSKQSQNLLVNLISKQFFGQRRGRGY